jgi:Zn finger protein HypA/HybF involved in hydrogenase expression
MRTTALTSNCHQCGRRVEDAMHVMLCDRCLDARLTEQQGSAVERIRALTVGASWFSLELFARAA